MARLRALSAYALRVSLSASSLARSSLNTASDASARVNATSRAYIRVAVSNASSFSSHSACKRATTRVNFAILREVDDAFELSTLSLSTSASSVSTALPRCGLRRGVVDDDETDVRRIVVVPVIV
jgi:hypothetical protein